MKLKKIVLLCILCLFIFSCSEEKGLETVELPIDTAINDANRFALITETYISLRDKPGDSGITVAHARRKDVFQVNGIEIVTKDSVQSLWVNLGSGWVPRSCLRLYPTKEKALTEAKKLK